jgi:chemotaxis protein methyltransferase WspC
MMSDFQLEQRIMEHIVERLADEAGIDPASLEPSRITWTVQRRCRQLGVAGAGDYVALFDASREELDNLIDALVIQETRFFRDPQVFDHLREWAQEMAAKSAGPLRILSAPCSTGQEAYSLAATLRCSGLPANTFFIDAFDISPSALAIAQRGIYPAGALEHSPTELQSACGTLRDRHWQMHEQLRKCIRFGRRNLTRADAIEDDAAYHLILCRNLFIYLHAPARATLASTLSRALLPGGRLIVGAGDRVAEINALFVPLRPAAGFGFIHRPASKASPQKPESTIAPVRLRAVRRNKLPAEPSTTIQPAATADEFYRRAVDCMERGNSRQAERRCRQALYLAPAHLPALEMLETLWHLHPNPRIKRALSARIERVRMEAIPASSVLRAPQGEAV